jgi:uncharacterized membrane protein YedE/YeeE
MDNFTPIASLVGGVLIGLSATILLLFNGRIAGISGILYNGLFGARDEARWRLAFLGGLILAGLVVWLVSPGLFAVEYDRSIWAVAVAGLLVGIGVRLGSGCTSGHGVCGLSRLSPRSLVATLTFITTGAITVWVARLVGGAG